LSDILIENTLGLRGEYRLCARNAETGEITRETEWFPNLITNRGLDDLGATGVGPISTCCVGEGNTAPAFTDVALVTYHQSTTNINRNFVTGTAPDYIGKCNMICLFPTQAVNKNYAEVGMGRGASGNLLWSRALIVDSGGAPTTFTVLVGEQLEVTYRLWLVPPIVDSTYNVTIAGVVYNCTTRASNLPSFISGSFMSRGIEWGSGTQTTPMDIYTGAIGAITASPSGSQLNPGTIASPAAYTTGNYYRDYTHSWSTSQANVGAGFRSIRYGVTCDAGSGSPTLMPCLFQTDFGAVIPKDNTKTMTLTLRWSWARI
jgi:hypothetical protein